MGHLDARHTHRKPLSIGRRPRRAEGARRWGGGGGGVAQRSGRAHTPRVRDPLCRRQNMKRLFPLNARIVQASPAFAHWPLDVVDSIIAAAVPLTFSDGDMIVEEGTPGHMLFFLSRGKVLTVACGSTAPPVRPVCRLLPE